MKSLALILLLSLGLNQLFAQPGNKRDKIESMKIGFITQKLNLTSEEAQKFWPVYNKFSSEIDKLRKGMHSVIRDEISDKENMTEADAEKTLNELINFREQEAAIFKKYAAEFKKVIPTTKVLKLFKAENDFKRELLKELHERREGGNRGR